MPHSPLRPPLGRHPACCPTLVTCESVLILLLNPEDFLQCRSSVGIIPGSSSGSNTWSCCDTGHVTYSTLYLYLLFCKMGISPSSP